MQKNMAMIENQVNDRDNEKPDRFNCKCDFAMGRVSYDHGIKDYFYEELQCIVSIFDMLVILSGNGHLSKLQEDSSEIFFIKARERAMELAKLI